MKNLAYTLLVLLVVGCASHQNKVHDEKVVKQVLNDFITAVQDKNFGELDNLTKDDFVIYENGLVWDFKEFSRKLEEYDSVKITYALSDLHLIVDENTAHAQFHNVGTFVFPDTTIVMKFIESATFVKDNGNWQVQFYHSTHSANNDGTE